MIKSLKRFAHYFSDSKKEFESNSKLYLPYVLFFVAISIVKTIVDTRLAEDALWPRVISQFLFSGIPILVLSKILYIIKVRLDGSAEYSEVLVRNILYSSYYFCMVMVTGMLYPLGVLLLIESHLIDVQGSFFVALPLLAPVLYVVMFYSLSPIVAVFEDGRGVLETFKRSRSLTKRDILLVFLSHLSSLVVPGFFGTLIHFTEAKWKVALGAALSVPEATLTIVILLTTIRIYTHLIEMGSEY